MQSPPNLVLDSEQLLSKWGFNDGGVPDEILDYALEVLDYEEIKRLEDHWHQILCNLVQTRLVPKWRMLHPDLEIAEFETSHNPIRLDKVFGIEDAWTGRHLPDLNHTSVTVPWTGIESLLDSDLSEDWFDKKYGEW